MKCEWFEKRPRLWSFIFGAAASCVAVKASKTQCARKFAVGAVAEGIKIKDGFERCVTEIKEDAEDLVAEAQAEAGGCESGEV